MNGTSPRSKSTQIWPPSKCFLEPPWMNPLHMGQYYNDDDIGDPRDGTQISELPSSCLYEDLFCSSKASIHLTPLAPLAGTYVGSSWPQSDVVKQGYLGKLEKSHRRYFVLRAGSHTGPSRLEWYKSQEKFTVMRKSSGSSKHGVIYLRCCLGVRGISSSRKGHTVALYAKDQTMVLVVEDQQEQDDWCFAIKKLIEEEQTDDEQGEGFDEDDGYGTLPPAASFKEVWPVQVKPRGLGRSKSLSGEMRLCLTASSLILVKVGAGSDLPSVTIPLLCVRRFGHQEGLFFLELGRVAPDGPGEIWMGAGDQGNPGIAQHIHEVVRETVHALRRLPDFGQSPSYISSQPQNLHSKRSRYKFRDIPPSVRPLPLPPRDADTQSLSKPCTPTATESESTMRFMSHLSPETVGGCVEMKTQEEEQGKGPGYMFMSPQASRGSSTSIQDEYMAMTSPQKHHALPYSSPPPGLHTSFLSEMSDECSPLRPPCLQFTENEQKKDVGICIRTSIDSCRLQDQWHPAKTRTTCSTPSLQSFSVSSPTHVSPNSMGLGRLRAVQEQVSVARRRLSSCLMSCLQSEDTS